ncbi:MAG TPA: hypothetical protein VHD87_01465 [Acidimicrobiales bacterium]|nr:hypothetical protein [Acidimicrobiales bacterium]
MFVQVITGKTTDPAAVRALGEKWQRDLRPGAVGYLGSTIGTAADGTFVAAIQFTDDVAAKENSERPEQDAFFKEMSQLFDGQPTFRESSDTSLLFDGPSAEAGFVQVMQSTCSDRAKAEAMESNELLDALRAARPGLLGGLRLWDGNQSIELAYFTSEADARAAEKSAAFDAPQQDFSSLYENTTYIDLPNPQIYLA